MQTTTASLPPAPKGYSALVRILVLAGLVLGLQIPVSMIENLTSARADAHGISATSLEAAPADSRPAARPVSPVAESYRLVRRAMKYEVLVFTLIFGSLFLFEVCSGLRLHPVHYILVGAAFCLFYLVLLSLVEITDPVAAYSSAVAASVALIGLYGAAILHSWLRAGTLAGFITGIYGILFILLELPKYALLAGTGTLFVLLAAAMYLTRNINWDGASAPAEAAAS